MTTRELVQSQLESTGKQVHKVLEGLADEQYGAKVTPEAMSPQETLQHLCDCYKATVATVAGGNYEWGTFEFEDSSVPGMWSEFDAARAEACKAVLSNDEQADTAFNYIVNHDSYHVGQLTLLRLQVSPDWNPYSLYE